MTRCPVTLPLSLSDTIESDELAKFERHLVLLLVLAVVVDLGREQLAGLDAIDPGVRDPPDIALPHLVLE